MITEAELLNTCIFRELLPEDLGKVIPCLTETTFPAGETIIYRGDPGYSMFVILSGQVDITLINDEGVEYSIHTMGAGDNFGEMALITGEPRSANVKSITEVRLAELKHESFLELIATYPKLMDGFFRQLAQRRASTKVREQFSNLERTEIISSLFTQQPPAIETFPGKTKWTSDLNASINRLAAAESHILILGERGTGKDLAARLIHFHSPLASRPLFHLDCANPPPIHRETGRANSEKDDIVRGLAQESAIFGHGADAGSFAKGVRKGYLELADGGAVILENIDALGQHIQLQLVTYLKEGTLARIGETQAISSKVRIITTTTKSLAQLKSAGALAPGLLELLSGEVLSMKPLRERKKDIPVIAEYIVEEYNKKFSRSVEGFTKEALNSLVDHDWPFNVDEMQQVLERAVVTAEGNTITERQIFLNLPSFSDTGKFNLLKIPFARQLANNRFFPTGLRLVTVPFILALIVLTLFGPRQNNPANLIVWAVWWPVLILSILVGARSWCGYCPMPVVSDGLNRYRKKYFSMPESVAKHGVWIGMCGFALILLSEHATHMFTAARATSVLLLSILGGTFIVNSLFGKRSWCKHICPLGRMIASSSSMSLVELGSNSNVCSSQCQTHDCIRDSNCPMGIHPSAAAASKDCVLCLSCVKKCKHQSIRLDMRLPWNELFVKERWTLAEAFFALSLTALVLAVKLPGFRPLAALVERQGWGSPETVDILFSVATGTLFMACACAASGLFSRASWKKNFAATGSAYHFLAFAGFLNIYLHEFVYSGHNLLPWIVEMVGLGAVVPHEWITPNLGTLKAVIPLVTLICAVASFLLLSRVNGKNALSPFVLRAHQGLMLVTTLVFLVIL